MGLLGRQGSGEEAISKIKGTKGRFTEEIRFSVRLGTNGRPASKLNARGQLHMHKHTKTNRHAHTKLLRMVIANCEVDCIRHAKNKPSMKMTR